MRRANTPLFRLLGWLVLASVGVALLLIPQRDALLRVSTSLVGFIFAAIGVLGALFTLIFEIIGGAMTANATSRRDIRHTPWAQLVGSLLMGAFGVLIMFNAPDGQAICVAIGVLILGVFGTLFSVADLLFSAKAPNTQRVRVSAASPPRKQRVRAVAEASRPAATDPLVAPARTPQGRHIYHHTLDNYTTRGINPDTLAMMVVDAGVVGCRPPDLTEVYRVEALPETVLTLQPFVHLRTSAPTMGQLRFALIDNDGATQFTHEAYQALPKGRRLLSSAAYLSLAKLKTRPSAAWHMRAWWDDDLLIELPIVWAVDMAQIDISQHLNADGELSAELSAAVQHANQVRLERLSLDSLLDDDIIDTSDDLADDAPTSAAKRKR
jgi:hypothetical protein